MNPQNERSRSRLAAIILIALTAGGLVLFAFASSVTGQRPRTPASPSIAFVKPTFTVAAYHDLFDPPSYPDSFYKFFTDNIAAAPGANVTSEIDLLTSNVTRADQIVASSAQKSEYRFLSLSSTVGSLMSPVSVGTLTDADVDGGKIFQNGTSDQQDAYQVLVLGHQEYVTSDEYQNLEKFVRNGGALILVDGDVFASRVAYNKSTESVTFLEGHGWAYDGTTAWKTSSQPFAVENAQFIGSNPCNPLLSDANFTLTYNPFGYDVATGEEQCLAGSGDRVLINYGANDPQSTIAAYARTYGNGKVFSMGVYGEDVLYSTPFQDFFDKTLEQALSNATLETTITTCAPPLAGLNYSRAEAWNYKSGTEPLLLPSSGGISVNGTASAAGRLSALLYLTGEDNLGDTLTMNLTSSSSGDLVLVIYDNVSIPSEDLVLWSVPVVPGAQQIQVSLAEGEVLGGFQIASAEELLLQLQVQPNQPAAFAASGLATVIRQAC